MFVNGKMGVVSDAEDITTFDLWNPVNHENFYHTMKI
jgi:hypothetical protein